MLLDRGADPNGKSYFKVPCRWKYSLGIEPELRTVLSPRPINSAIDKDNMEMVANLVKRGTNLNAIQTRCRASRSSLSAYDEESHRLYRALELNREKMVDFLVTKGAEVSEGNFCPVLAALSKGNVENFRTFMKSKTFQISDSTLEELLLQCQQIDFMWAVRNMIENTSPEFKFADPGPLLGRVIAWPSTLMMSWLLKREISPF